ncbi:MAG TPA: HAMP domain-containing sensor histidine kinase [Ktedonobacteraceae bacterium]
MHHLQSFARFLLGLPEAWRLWIVILGIIGGQWLFFLLAPWEQNPHVLAIPVVLAAWFYRKRGMLICLGTMAVITWFYLVVIAARPVSVYLVMSFVTSGLTLLVVGLFISMQRGAFDLAEEGRRQLAGMRSEEMQFQQARQHFLQHVNHELKTPLTALSASLELLQQQHARLGEEERAGLLQNAVSSCDELQLLVSNILESLQVDEKQAQTLKAQETPLVHALQEIVRQADAPWQLSERVRLEIAEDLRVLAYPQYLRQLLRNLLSNAVKYAPGKLPILISARRTNHPTTLEPEVCVSVKDWGPGIPPDEIHLLFDQFTRLKRDSLSEIRGSGLGLSISKCLVEAMGGRIWVESSGIPGEGSCFSFTLPAASARADLAPSTLPGYVLASRC